MIGALKQVGHAEDGLEIEAALHAATGDGFALWMADNPAIVCPRSLTRRPGFADAAQQSRERGWPVCVRGSGGGAVPQGRGVLNVALGMTKPRGFTIEAGYRMLTDMIRNAVGQDGDRLETGDTPGSFCDGAWNLMIGGRKLAGLAQHWRTLPDGNLRVLAHAMILVECDVDQGARAVNLFHRDLTLPSIRAAAHTTLRQSFFRAKGWADFPKDLMATAEAAVACPASRTNNKAA